MGTDLHTILVSSAAVFGLLGLSWAWARRRRPDLRGTLRVGMDLFVPCLAFTSILDSRIDAGAVAIAAGATAIQIGLGLAAGWALILLLGWRQKRELMMPIAFVNAANLPFPLLLANFGTDGLAIGVVCYTVMNLTVYPAGVLLLRERTELKRAFAEPALWATVAAGLLRLLHVRPPEVLMVGARLAAAGAVPIMLVLFGDALARTRLGSIRFAAPAVLVRFLSGALALWVTLRFLQPDGLLRQVLILYALLPPAMVNVILVQNAGRDEEATAATVLLGTLVAVILLPILLALGR